MKRAPNLSFLRLQIKRHTRSTLIWVVVWGLLSLLYVAVFNDLSKTADQSIKLYQSLPPALLKTVNISTDYLTKPEKFLAGQFLTTYLLAGSIFAVFWGVGAIGSKIENKTLVNLLTKPFSRGTIYVMQALGNLVSLAIGSIGVGIIMFSVFALLTDKSVSVPFFVSLFVGTAIIFAVFALLGQLLGVISPKGCGEALGSGLAVFSFLINGLGALAGVPAWLQKCSVYYYFDAAQLRDAYSLNLSRMAVLLIIGIVLLGIGWFTFRRKDLYM